MLLKPMMRSMPRGTPRMLLRLQSANRYVTLSAPLCTFSRSQPTLLQQRQYKHQQIRTIITRDRQTNSLETIRVSQMMNAQDKYRQSRMAFLVAAFLASFTWVCISAYRLSNIMTEDEAKGRKQAQLESERKSKTTGVGGIFSSPPRATVAAEEENRSNGTAKMDTLPGSAVPVGSKIVIHNPDGSDLIPTGNSAVKYFPRIINLPGAHDSTGGLEKEVEYTLVGLGIRTVTFLQFSVYVVGFYVATQDVSGVQERLVKRINPLASTLVPSERESLRQKLDEPTSAGEELWETALFPARTVMRIVPVRDTNFPHLRDGFVRAITQRRDPQASKDEDFGRHMREFKQSFNKGKLPASSELLMLRNPSGKLDVSYVDAKGSGKTKNLCEIDEPRISRALWMNYLSGQVASPEARESIVQGVMDFVERPVGTVAAQVV